MNRPICLIGSLNMAKVWINENFNLDNYESLILEDDLSIEKIKDFRYFLISNSINKRIAIIFGFNKLNCSKQSILLKIFESLGNDLCVVIHSFTCVSFVINTRCEIKYLSLDKDLENDISWLNNYFYTQLIEKKLDKEKFNAIKLYIDTLNLYKIGLLSTEQKKSILDSLV